MNYLLGEIDLLKKDRKISGASVVAHWMCRRIQPLQQRVHLGFQFTGEEEPTRFTRDKISHADVMHRVNRVLEGIVRMPNVGGTFRAGKRPREVSLK